LAALSLAHAKQTDRTAAEVAKAFVRDMRAFFAAGHNTIKADGIAAQQLYLLKQHYPGKLKLTDVKEMFLQMRDLGVISRRKQLE
jgi:hypothetical protein